MYPSERYQQHIERIHPDFREQVKEYVDESDHDGISPKELECHSWREVIEALTRYVHSHQYTPKHAKLIADYKQYLESVLPED